jgi:hypothetical protein
VASLYLPMGNDQIGIGVAWHSDGLWMSPNVSDLCQVLEVTQGCDLAYGH